MRRRIVVVGDAMTARFGLGAKRVVALDEIALERREPGDTEIMGRAGSEMVTAFGIVKRSCPAPTQTQKIIRKANAIENRKFAGRLVVLGNQKPISVVSQGPALGKIILGK